MDFDVPILSDADSPPPPPPPARAEIDLDALLNGMTGPQREAVLHTEGPLLVLAAAGSGKTRVITRRIAYLIHLGVPAWQIMALTFTNKAAGEMRERIHAILGGGEGATDGRASRGLTVTTFHSLCARLLRRYAEPAGLKPDFAIYDSSDQMSLVKKAIEACQLSTSNFPARSVLSAISNAKNDLVDADAFAASAMDYSTKAIAKIYRAYTDALRRANAVDFDDLLLLTARTLGRDASVREECRRRWQYLLVDEYQDTNKAQFQIASLIIGVGTEKTPEGEQRRPNICVVGDPDQAIYGWRGADISNILDFEEHYPSAAVIKLGENFRSTPAILDAADTLIKHNKRRKHKPLFSSKEGGERIEVVACNDERQEAGVVAQWLRDRHGHAAWREMAVFYRTNALSRVIEEALRTANIPYSIARGTSFYEREEVRSALAYLRVVANPADSVSLGRIVNVPTRGIGGTSFTRVEDAAEQARLPVFEVMRTIESVPELTARATGAIRKFVSMVDAWTGGGSFMGSEVPHSLHELVDRVVKESGLEAMYKTQAATTKSETDMERLDNLAELVSSAAEFEQEWDPTADPAAGIPTPGASEPPPLLSLLRAYLESIALVADADAVDPAQGSVTLMTLHAAKGLEFPAVAMIGLEEALLPHARALENDAAMEEERRLCFVGITRAMRRLLMTHAKYRTMRGIPERTRKSRFLDELGNDNINASDRSRIGEDAWDEPQDRGVVHPAPQRRPGSASAFPVGSNVRHPQFGVGIVQTVTGGANARVTVLFRGLGLKTLVLDYARLTKV